MDRALWRGAISFGLIFVPVEIHTASKENGLPLHMLDSRDFEPIGFRRINKATGREVDWAHIVKGFEYKKNEYVALSDADFKHANVKASETIDIDTFCDVADIPAYLYDTPYHLRSGKGGDKVFQLLRQALQQTRKVAVATFVMRGRQHLCALTPQGNSLMLLTLRFADEVSMAAGAAGAVPRISAAELSMAKKLVAQMSGPFKPERFKETYRADLKRRIQEKIRRKQVHVIDAVEPPSGRPKAEVIDLMDALKASLVKRGAGRPTPLKRRSPQRKSL